MSISFSGLASGLDTSSWITSLTALKQAKVTTLQQQRENVLLSKNTLNSIKTFFSSFRSTIERITDSKFNIATMNLFAQNLATSANLKVLTATATSEAEEGKYEVKVDKLATNTQAVSKYNYQTTIVETTTATDDTLLKNLGVSSGSIYVTVDGEDHLLRITDKETIGSFIAKLESIGVEADFNERTGIFSASIGANHINDTLDNTGIVNGLHLSNVNKGFTSNGLTFEKVETLYTEATGETRLDALGVSSGTLVINANDAQYQVELIVEDHEEEGVQVKGDTLQDLIDALQSEGIDASIDNGVFSLKDALIVDDGTTGLINAFGLDNTEVSNSNQQSDALNIITHTATVAATGSTLLKDINPAITISDTDTIEIYREDDSENTQTITLSETMTIDELFSAMGNAGVEATITQNGVVTIHDEFHYINGTVDIYELFGLEETYINAGSYIVTGSGKLMVTVDGGTTTINQNSTIGELYKPTVSETGTYTITGTINSDGSITGGNVVAINSAEDLEALKTLVESGGTTEGYTFVLTDDITLASDWNGIGLTDSNYMFKGTFDGLGHTITFDNSANGLFVGLYGGTVQNTSLKGSINFTNANIDGYINSGGALSNIGIDFNVNNCSSDVDFNANLSGEDITIGGLIGTVLYSTMVTINNCEISGSINASGNYVEVGGFIGQIFGCSEVNINNISLDMDVSASGTETTTACCTIADIRESNLYIDNLYFKCDNYDELTGMLYIVDQDYSDSYTVNTSNLITSIEEYIEGSSGIAYYKGNVNNPENFTFLSTATEMTQAGEIAKSYGYDTSVWAFDENGNVQIKNVGAPSTNAHNEIKVESWDGYVYGTITLTDTMSMDTLLTELETYGFTGYIEDGCINLTSDDGKVLTGDFVDALGLSTSVETSTVAVAQTSTIAVTYTTTAAITGTTKLSEFLTLSDTTFTKEMKDEPDSGADFDLEEIAQNIYSKSASELTVNEFLFIMQGEGFTTSLSADGKITLESECCYLSGSIFDQMGIGVTSTTTSETLAVNQSSSEAVTYTTTTAITGTTKLSEFLDLSDTTFWDNDSNSADNYSVYDLEQYAIEYYSKSASELTVNEFLNLMADLSYEGSLSADGKITLECEGWYLTGSIFDQMGINVTGSSSTNMVSSSEITYSRTITTHATSSTKVGEIYEFKDTAYVFDGTINELGGVTGSVIEIADETTFQYIQYGLDSGETYEGITFVLTNDLSLDNSNWYGTGTFAGTLDGQGYNVELSLCDECFFDTVTGTIKNLSTSGNIIVQGEWDCGGIANTLAGGKLENCSSSVNIEVQEAGSYYGGLVGNAIAQESSLDIINCEFTGYIHNEASEVSIGGIVGYTTGDLIISNCKSAGTIYNYGATSGGLIAELSGDITGGVTIANCIDYTVFDGDAESHWLAEYANIFWSVYQDPGGSYNWYGDGDSGVLSQDQVYNGEFASLGFDTNCWDTSTASLKNVGAKLSDRVIYNGSDYLTITESTTLAEIDVFIDDYDFTYNDDGSISVTAGGGWSSVFIDTICNGEAFYVTNTVAGTATSETELGLLANISPYTITGTISAGATYSSGDVIAITSAEDLLIFKDMIDNGNTFTGVTFVLTNDIDLTDTGWSATQEYFSGTFDGQGYNITLEGDGLFGYLMDGTIKNLSVSGYASSLGGIVDYASGLIENCSFTGSISDGSGIVGKASGDGDLIIKDCLSSGTISGSGSLGGIIGEVNYTGYTISIENCSFTGTIESDDFGYYGGIVGNVYGGTVEINGCDVTGSIVGQDYCGAYVGATEYAEEDDAYGTVYIDNCYKNTALSDIGYYSGHSYITNTRSTAMTNTVGSQRILSGEIVINNPDGTVNSTITCTATTTFQDLIDMLADKGVSASVQDGILTVSDGYTLSGDLAEHFNLEEEIYSNYSNTSSSAISVQTEATITEDTRWSELWIDIGDEIEISNLHTGNRVGSVTYYEDTIAETAVKLSDYDIEMTVVDGKINIKYNGDYIISNTPSTYAEILGISTDHSSIQTTTTYDNTESNTLSVISQATLNEDTTWANLGVTEDFEIVLANSANSNKVTVTISSTETYRTTEEALHTNYRVNLNSSNGIANISYDDSWYILSADPEFAQALNMNNNFSDIEATSEITSNELSVTAEPITVKASTTTKLGDLVDADGNHLSDYVLGFDTGTEYTFTANDTIQTVIDRLADDGYEAKLNADGTLSITGYDWFTEYSYSGGLGSLIMGSEELYIDDTMHAETVHRSENISVQTVQTSETAVSNDTLLSDYGVTSGEYFIYNNGVKYVAMIGAGDTIGDFRDTLSSFGIQSGLVETADGINLMLKGNGSAYIETSTSANASNVVDKLFSNDVSMVYNYSAEVGYVGPVTTVYTADKDTLLSQFDQTSSLSAGTLALTYDGNEYNITITSNETFGTLIDKFEEIGISATLYNGELKLNAIDKEISIDAAASTSKLTTNIGLVYSNSLENITSSSKTVDITTSTVEERTGSVSKHADLETVLGSLNISSGSFTVYRNGQKASITIDSEETFKDLEDDIQEHFSDVGIRFKDGYLEFYSETKGVHVSTGSSVDTSNITSICGLSSKGDVSRSSRELYKANGNIALTTSGLFARGDVTEGTFTIGDAEFTIDENTTLNDIITQINSSSETNATAYWDTVSGKFAIKSRVTGASLINIEAGTSNFTDILGLTTSEWNDDGSLAVTKLNSNAQEIGNSAKFSINGTEYTSTSNIISSDITRIKGLTLDLKSVSNGETVTVTVEKDYDTIANAMKDIVDSYNNLIENVDKELASDGKLNDQSTLKLIRNQIRSLMVGSTFTTGSFKNLASIGISTEAASSNNISVANIDKLEFNKDKFIEAYRSDSESLKELLVGNGNGNNGILNRVESVIEQAVASASGYFSSADNSFSKQISRLDTKIEKATLAVANYKARLESKFQHMDMMISKMQEQFSTFLGT